MPILRYRSEIDGLRAISVIGVVLFHFGLGFPGGFVGVDVFFVISGFLISSILKREIEGGTFSMANFWSRRIKRILPAVTVMVLLSLVLGYLILPTAAFHSLAKSAFAQSIMSANIYFGRSVGYFATASDFKPLLHSWSLSVEEQFYIVLPILLFAVSRWRTKLVFPLLVMGAVVSFALSCYGLFKHPSFTFYMLPTRAWELLAGSLLAYSTFYKNWRRTTAEVISAIGLMMILCCMFLYDHGTTFPGYNALLPVLGATLFIAGNANSLTYAGRLLTLKILVFIGLISYSLYLWHWPIIVFARYIVLDVNMYWKCGMFLLSFIMAYLSWRFIETPFRSNELFYTSRSTLRFGGLVTAGALAIAGFIFWGELKPKVTNHEEMNILAEDIEWNGELYSLRKEFPAKPAHIGDDSVSYSNFAIWGDSHAMASIEVVNKLAKEANLKGSAYIDHSHIPVTNVYRFTEFDKLDRLSQKEMILNHIIKSHVSDLILISRWSTPGIGTSYTKRNICPDEAITESLSCGIPINSAKKDMVFHILASELNKMCLRLNQNGIRVWILKQAPECDNRHAAFSFFLSKRFPSINELVPTNVTRESHAERQKLANQALDSIPSELATILDPSAESFDDQGYLITHSADRSYYKDDDHLTRAGAEAFLSESLYTIFNAIKNR